MIILMHIWEAHPKETVRVKNIQNFGRFLTLIAIVQINARKIKKILTTPVTFGEKVVEFWFINKKCSCLSPKWISGDYFSAFSGAAD